MSTFYRQYNSISLWDQKISKGNYKNDESNFVEERCEPIVQVSVMEEAQHVDATSVQNAKIGPCVQD